MTTTSDTEPWQWLFSSRLELHASDDPTRTDGPQRAAARWLVCSGAPWWTRWRTREARILARGRRVFRRHLALTERAAHLPRAHWKSLEQSFRRIASTKGFDRDACAAVAGRLAPQLAFVLKVRHFLNTAGDSTAEPSWLESDLLACSLADGARSDYLRLYAVFLVVLRHRALMPTQTVHDNVALLAGSAPRTSASAALLAAYAELVSSVSGSGAEKQPLSSLSELTRQAAACSDALPPALCLLRAVSRSYVELGTRQLRSDAELEAGTSFARALAYDPYNQHARERLVLLATLPERLGVEASRSRGQLEVHDRLVERAARLREAARRADGYLESAAADEHRARFAASLPLELVGSLELDAVAADPESAARLLVRTLDEAHRELRSCAPSTEAAEQGHEDLVARIVRRSREQLETEARELLLLDWGRIAQALRCMSEPSGSLLALTLPPIARESLEPAIAAAQARRRRLQGRAREPRLAQLIARWTARVRSARPHLPCALAAAAGGIALLLSAGAQVQHASVVRARERAHQRLLTAAREGTGAELRERAEALISLLASEPADKRHEEARQLRARAVLRQSLELHAAQRTDEAYRVLQDYLATTPVSTEERLSARGEALR